MLALFLKTKGQPVGFRLAFALRNLSSKWQMLLFSLLRFPLMCRFFVTLLHISSVTRFPKS